MNNNILRPCLILFIISALCVSALAYVNEITKAPIAAQEKLAIDNAYKELFPTSSDFKEDEVSAPEGSVITKITGVYTGDTKDGEIISIGQKGYGGTINLMVGIKQDGSLAAVKVLSHSETPGLGAYCESPSFTDQFKGKGSFPLEVSKTKTTAENEVEAIASSTITSKAVTDAVNTAHEWFEKEGGGN